MSRTRKPTTRLQRAEARRRAPKRGPNRAFSDAEVREIRRRLDATHTDERGRLVHDETGAAIAAEYGVSLRTIYDLKARRSYRDVK